MLSVISNDFYNDNGKKKPLNKKKSEKKRSIRLCA